MTNTNETVFLVKVCEYNFAEYLYDEGCAEKLRSIWSKSYPDTEITISEMSLDKARNLVRR